MCLKCTLVGNSELGRIYRACIAINDMSNVAIEKLNPGTSNGLIEEQIARLRYNTLTDCEEEQPCGDTSLFVGLTEVASSVDDCFNLGLVKISAEALELCCNGRITAGSKCELLVID